MSNNNAFAATSLTGGTDGALDDINHDYINDGDMALVADHANELWYAYTYDSSCSDSESSPGVIIPDSNSSGTGAWVLLYSAMNKIINAKYYGVAGDGSTDDTDNMQAAITAAAGGTLWIPDGTYLIDSDTLEVKSNTRIVGESWKTILKGSYTPAVHDEYNTETGGSIRMILTNDDMSSGNTNIRIENIYFDFTAATDGQSVCIHFRNCSDWQVVNCKTEDGGDGISATYADDFLIEGNLCVNHLNAGIDVWGGSEDGKIVNNTIQGNGTDSTYGILVTGADTDFAPDDLTTERIQVINNNIYNVTDTAIWLQGAGSGDAGNSGHCYDCEVIGNIINTIAEYHGIKVTSGGRHIIVGNNLQGIEQIGISLASEESGEVSAPDNCVISNNIIRNASAGGSGNYSSIKVGDTNDYSSNNIISNNIILGSNHDYGIESGNASNAGNIIFGNYIADGVTGEISFSGTTNYVRSIATFAEGLANYFANGVNIKWRNNAGDGTITGISIDSNDDVIIGENTAGVGLNIQNPTINFAALTTSTSAVAGSNGDVPAQVVGYINVQIGGTNYRIPYYND